MKLLGLAAAALLLAATAGAANTHTVVQGEHLWGLAGHYYRNSYRWQAIFAANQDKIKDPNRIYPGQVLTIPDLPSTEVGELPAQPLPQEASAATRTAPPEEAAAVQPPPQQAQAASAPAAAPAPAAAQEAPPPAEDLSASMPAGMAGMYPSMVRVAVDKSWKEDGRITEFEGREILAAAGDSVVGTLDQPAQEGDEFQVYRQAAPLDSDAGSDAKHLQPVGVVKVQASLGKDSYRFLILQSVDPVEAGDLLKKGS